ncbi:MAG TPA: hypothetical protein VKC54_03835 [Patescibacteria group bacterium]|nr:hypothetical protein [Patescibacteria group bacterium]
MSSAIVSRFKILNSLIFPYLFVLSMSLSVLESVIYQGLVRKYLFIDLKLIIFATVISGFFAIIDNNFEDKFTNATSFVLHLNSLFLPVILIFYWLGTSTESSNYPNYLFSTFHISPESFLSILLLSVYFRVLMIVKKGIGLKFSFKKSKTTAHDRRPFYLKLLIAMLIFFAISNMVKVFNSALTESLFIMKHINFTYDEKMEYSWRFLYKYMVFVKENTPEDSIIRIPPSIRPWLSEGNSVLVRYFLYPRKLISPDEPLSLNWRPDYYLLAKGSWTARDESEYGWPKEKIAADKVIYFDTTTNRSTVFIGNYNPLDVRNKNAWGLIKVKK